MIEPFQLKDDSYFVIESWMNINPNLIAGFTTKNNGFSKGHFSSNNFGFHVGDDPEAVKKNRQILGEKIDFPINQWVCAEQTHGNNVMQVTISEIGKGALNYSSSITGTDGLFTNEKNILLALCYADCVPVYFFAPNEQLAGVVHAGWRGTVQNISQELISKWEQIGVDISTVKAVIGPSICQDCYKVDNLVIEAVDRLDLRQQHYKIVSDGQYSLDLKGVNKSLLLQNGILEDNIQITNFCTSCHNSLFYSHRANGGKTGRMAAFIGIREASL